ncbi:ankyrin repeat-containing domain protein [Mycena leptocephala]|nr:ankyrin repeat-containing domain protein [Mycena leptocephala]
MQARNIEIARLLLEAGADPAAERDVQDHRPIHLAAMNGDLTMMKLLLAHGARVDDQCGQGESALHHACSVGNLQMVELLLDSGANLESRGYYGTALGFALHSRQSEVMRRLLYKGAATLPPFTGGVQSFWFNSRFLAPLKPTSDSRRTSGKPL